jgi:hypothetical protein
MTDDDRKLHSLWLLTRILGRAECTELFMGKPDRWYDKPKWRCTNDHVSDMYIKSEVAGDLCPRCQKNVVLTFPEDREGPLDITLNPYLNKE